MKAEVVRIDAENPDKSVLKKAAAVIGRGGLVAFPTETVYGLGADYLNKKAIDRLYEVKNRPKEKPFTVHISDLGQLAKLSCEMDVLSKELMERFWPGPLTLILKTKSGGKIGVRMPKNKIALEFISACGNAIAAPSANLSGNEPPRRAEDVLKDLEGTVELVLDGGETELGIESTVVDASIVPYRILRKGAISESRITDAGGA